MQLQVAFVDQKAVAGDEAARSMLMPKQQSVGAAGFDLTASNETPVLIKPRAFAAIPTGISIHIPTGFEGQVRPRSGLAFRHGVTVLNSPGTIDSDYRGEVKILLINHGETIFEVTRGMRVAQLVLAPLAIDVELLAVQTLGQTARGAGGFGSTGVST